MITCPKHIHVSGLYLTYVNAMKLNRGKKNSGSTFVSEDKNRQTHYAYHKFYIYIYTLNRQLRLFGSGMVHSTKDEKKSRDRQKYQQNYLRHKLIESEIINYKHTKINKEYKNKQSRRKKVYPATFGSPR